MGEGWASGIDVSKWQTRTPDLTGQSFLFARATIGLTADERYAQHIAAAKAAGIVTGAYHFNWDSLDAREQARYFVATAGDVDLLWVDVEGPQAFSKAQTRDFVDEVHAAGRRCGLYHSLSGYFDAGQDHDWVAKWSDTPPSIRWDFWQEGATRIGGQRIDHNWFRGTPDELRAEVSMKPLRITQLATKIVTIPADTQFFGLDGTRLRRTTGEVVKTSPYEVTTADGVYRVVNAAYDGDVVLALVKVAQVTAADPPADPTPFDQEDVDRLTAAIAAERDDFKGRAADAIDILNGA
jgi:hypothetical protein